MPGESTGARIRAFILKQFPLARKRTLEDGDSLLGGGILDSLGILEVVAFVETEFRITITDEDLVPETFHSIESIAQFVEDKRARDGGPPVESG